VQVPAAMRRLAEEAGVEFRLGSQFEVTRMRYGLSHDGVAR
jgi:hypothetical protein